MSDTAARRAGGATGNDSRVPIRIIEWNFPRIHGNRGGEVTIRYGPNKPSRFYACRELTDCRSRKFNRNRGAICPEPPLANRPLSNGR